MTHFNRKLSKESGNIFFALFGAVALAGVVTAATSNLLAGPVTTVVKMNQKTAADANMATSAHLILSASAKAADGDCDADGLTEPVAPVACATAPAGAGCIPGSTGSSKTDPWNTPFAYCAYDHGARDAGVCPGRLAGENPTGPVLIALISAGPDKVFQTTCADAPAYITRAQGSDDVVATYSPALAMQVGGGDGVWQLDPSDQTTASTAKDLSINTEMNFASAAGANFSQDSRLDLGAGGLFFLPDQNSLLDGQCNSINKGSVRRKTSPTTEALQICDGSAWIPVGVPDFLSLIDTPDSYASKQGAFVRVDGAGLQFSSAAFLELSDTPNTFSGQAGKAVKVNSGATALEFGNLNFTDLQDTPNAYTGQAGKVVAVKADSSGLEFIASSGGGTSIHAGWPNIIICNETTSFMGVPTDYPVPFYAARTIFGGPPFYVEIDHHMKPYWLSFSTSTAGVQVNPPSGGGTGRTFGCGGRNLAWFVANGRTR